ncbi:MAG: gamma-glutamyl-gamma-aminobutyrate hydrolase family protein, partial [Planctomycetales bacterium]|nr:gamma-glutamyl-gamma-aminobutyrate hydrolase family protein [Planctomycetales bacterium]
CLGHQAVAAAFGGLIVRAPQPVHGRTSLIQHRQDGLFAGLPNPLTVCRYHSLVVDRATFLDELRVTSQTDDGLAMSVQHRRWPVFGVQFHPEAVLTDKGLALIANFLRCAGLEALPQALAEIEPAFATDRPELAPPNVAGPVTF